MRGVMRGKPLRLLVAIDFSTESRKALRVSRELAARAGGSLTLLHVRPQSDIRAAVVEERGDLLDCVPGALAGRISAHYSARLDRFAGKKPGEARKLRRGRPAIELRREAREGYDLLVMGSRGRGRVAATLLGSTVQEILTAAPIPVLVVRR
jgi:nucleotide-binding universal stress UspA family protein